MEVKYTTFDTDFSDLSSLTTIIQDKYKEIHKFLHAFIYFHFLGDEKNM